jgi:serine/threonine-protein kinase
MSPEQVQGGSFDARTDVYSLGAVCYEALLGRRAIRGQDLGRIMANVLDAVPEPATEILPGVPPLASAALAAALAKDPGERPTDVAAWAEAFAGALETMPEGLTPGWTLVD